MARVTRRQAETSIQDGVIERDEDKNSALLSAQELYTEIEGRRSFFQLRKKWSTAIIWWIWILIGFNSFLAASVGYGWMNFIEYKWFITAVTVETFLQIVGMGYVAVRFLFSNTKPTTR